MDKDNLLKEIKDGLKQDLKWSDPTDPITDDEYLNKKKGILNVKGYGLYDENKENRYCLFIDLPKNNEKETLTALLMNPANTFPPEIAKMKNVKPRFDQTIRNLIMLANAVGYKHVIVLNAFPYIEGDSTRANKYYKKHKDDTDFQEKQNLNFAIVKTIMEKNKELLVACGDSVSDELYKKYLGIIKANNNKSLTLYAYANEDIKKDTESYTALTAKGRPRHLSTQSKYNREHYILAIKNKKLYELKIKELE